MCCLIWKQLTPTSMLAKDVKLKVLIKFSLEKLMMVKETANEIAKGSKWKRFFLICNFFNKLDRFVLFREITCIFLSFKGIFDKILSNLLFIEWLQVWWWSRYPYFYIWKLETQGHSLHCTLLTSVHLWFPEMKENKYLRIYKYKYTSLRGRFAPIF